jgi:hypothetical protein
MAVKCVAGRRIAILVETPEKDCEILALERVHKGVHDATKIEAI